MNDLISRLSEIRSNYNCFDEKEEPYYRALSEAIQLEQKRGKWINPADLICYKCSICGNYINQNYGFHELVFWNYCPNCGTKMDGGKDNETN